MNPGSVAVVGASPDVARIGGRLTANLRSAYRGELVAVSRRHADVQGLPTVASVADLASAPDLVVVAVPSAEVVEVARQCVAVGAPGLAVLTAGFAESGVDGQALQADLLATVAGSRTRLMGPNCMGLVHNPRGLRATFSAGAAAPATGGGAAILSQSGAFGMYLYRLAEREGLGVSTLVTTGNEADLAVSDFLEHLGTDADTEVLVLFLESIKDPAALVAAARAAVANGKRVVAMKVGTSVSGARSALSHTGALSAPAALVSASFEAAGVIEVRTAEELIAFAKVARSGRTMRGDRVGVVTGSGGVGIILADAAEGSGLVLPPSGPDLVDRLSTLIPAYGSTANPIDYTAQLLNDGHRLAPILRAVLEAPDFDALYVASVPGVPDVVSMVVDAFAATDKPVVARSADPELNLALSRAGVPAMESLDLGLRALAALRRIERDRTDPHEPSGPPAGSDRVRREPRPPGTLPEHLALDLLDSGGIPVVARRVVAGADAAVDAAKAIGFPVVLKLSSVELPHKSDSSALRLRLADEAAVRSAYDDLAELARRAAPDAAVLVERMVPPGIELCCGIVRDPAYGPFVSVGMGGQLVEVFGEQQLVAVPAGPARLRRAVEGLFGGRLVRSPRGLDPDDLDGVVAVLSSLSHLATQEPALMELDLNPLVVTDDGVVVVDALAVFR